eukprot:TRINITY_DN961_c0_g1_i1.p1 TRINITY_DN961_c0_g1~~TRINITY_DN961_c0_g1_i1.p1  ORF type:complete len:246 (-),score=35.77 TRINITY_DN961_c0_g1_i1:76-813(-)
MMAFRVVVAVCLFLQSAGLERKPSEMGLGRDPAKEANLSDISTQITASLRNDCGERCVEVFDAAAASVLEANSSRTADADPLFWHAVLLRLYDEAKVQLLRGKHLHEALGASVDADRQNFSSDIMRKSMNIARPHGGAGIACGSAALCRMTSFSANRCTYARKAMQTVYQGVNLVAHTMTVVMNILCGCIFVQKQAVCALASVPFACSLPYNLYNSMFTMSVQMWEGVKTSTSACMIHGGVTISK